MRSVSRWMAATAAIAAAMALVIGLEGWARAHNARRSLLLRHEIQASDYRSYLDGSSGRRVTDPKLREDVTRLAAWHESRANELRAAWSFSIPAEEARDGGTTLNPTDREVLSRLVDHLYPTND